MKRHAPLNFESLEGRALLSGLSYSLSTNQSTFQPGQPVVMTFQETNVSAQVISVEVGPSTDGFDVAQGGKVIWSSNAGINPLFIQSESLQPGQSLTLTATWNGVPTGGTTPVSGTFVITNQMHPETSATVAISNSPVNPSVNPAPPTNNPQPIGVGTNPGPPVRFPNLAGRPIATPTSSDPGAQASTTAAGSSPIVVSVATDHPAYHMGQRVRMTVAVRNDGNGPVKLPTGSGQGWTLYEGSTPVWHRSRFAVKGGSHRLKPGQTVKLTASWNGKDHPVGVSLATGTYTLAARAGNSSGLTTFQVEG